MSGASRVSREVIAAIPMFDCDPDDFDIRMILPNNPDPSIEQYGEIAGTLKGSAYVIRFDDFAQGALETALATNHLRMPRSKMAKMFRYAFTDDGKPRKSHCHEGEPFLDPEGKVISIDGQRFDGGKKEIEDSSATIATMRQTFGKTRYDAWLERVLYAHEFPELMTDDEIESEAENNTKAKKDPKNDEIFGGIDLGYQGIQEDQSTVIMKLKQEKDMLVLENQKLHADVGSLNQRLAGVQTNFRALLHHDTRAQLERITTDTLRSLDVCDQWERKVPNTGKRLADALAYHYVHTAKKIKLAKDDLGSAMQQDPTLIQTDFDNYVGLRFPKFFSIDCSDPNFPIPKPPAKRNRDCAARRKMHKEVPLARDQLEVDGEGSKGIEHEGSKGIEHEGSKGIEHEGDVEARAKNK